MKRIYDEEALAWATSKYFGILLFGEGADIFSGGGGA
jgi:hypothetical protein